MQSHCHARLVVLSGLIALGLATPPEALARIKLITLPKRQRVEIQLDHPNVTLVEEERVVPLLKGVNQVDFAWANTAIDKDSIQFRALTDPEHVKVLSVSYPPNENALVWQVSAAESGPAKVRISYIIGQLNKSFEYRATASHDEKTLLLTQYVRLTNLANEEFGDAGLWAGFGEHFLRPIGINETKQVLSAKFAGVPVQKTYTCNPAEFDYLDRGKDQLRVPMHYVLKNDKAHQLGQFPLMPGKARIFQDDGKGGSAFVGEDWGRFTPIDDEMKLYLGLAKDIVVKRTIERRDQKRVGGNLYNYDVVIKYEIENFKDSPAVLDVSESLHHIRNEIRGESNRDVDWELGKETTFADTLDKEKGTFDKVIFHIPLQPRAADGKAEKVIHELHVLIKNEW
ncbi:MAG TPA: hypothetical protein PKY77_10755 [Phycisphaerae bacterium]|nr:hypothetical protein [Phycisphaerae bacterium]HRY70059.1 hypothetical protein [Phycisphaerae bacterium]HSA27335.1 hypothetical protein [Phycisphaerae bacterium]